MIKAVIFDWGGVIAPNPNGGWLHVLATILDMTIDEILPHWRAAGYEDLSKGTINETKFWSQLERSLGKPLPDEKERIWTNGTALHPWPQVLSLVDWLRKKGIISVVLSNVVRPVSTILRREGLYNEFDIVVLSDEVGLVKPDAAIYRLALDKLGLRADECIYIDDLPKNLTPAAALGMAVVLALDDPDKIVFDVKSLILS